jgi:hypothetical protein
MKVYEAILEYIQLSEDIRSRIAENPDGDYSTEDVPHPKTVILNSHQMMDFLREGEVKQECKVENPGEFLSKNLNASVDTLFEELTGVDYSQRKEQTEFRELADRFPRNSSVPFAFAMGGRMQEARDLMRFILDKGVASEESSKEIFQQYERKYRDRNTWYTEEVSESDELFVKSVERPSEEVQEVLGGVAQWASSSFTGPQLLQVEVPVGAKRIAESGEGSVELDQSVAEVLTKERGGDTVSGLPFEKEVARDGGARVAAGCVKADFVLINHDAVYVGEIKSRLESIDGQQDFYKPLGQALEYAIRLSEDYPTIASETNIYPVIATPRLGVDLEDLSPSLRYHGVGLFTNGWLQQPNGEFRPPGRDFITNSRTDSKPR